MKMSDLKTAAEISSQYGVKALAYGGPGTGKTPLAATAPRPIILAVETGLASLRYVTNVPVFEALTVEKIEEFFKWWFESAEARNFDTLCIDSVSQVAEVYYNYFSKKYSHGEKVYGAMGEAVYALMCKLDKQKEKNMYIIAKLLTDQEEQGKSKKPYFPGRFLGTNVPHLFDIIMYLSWVVMPTVTPPQQLCWQCQGSANVMARNRAANANGTPKLDLYEPPNLTNLFNKYVSKG